MSNQSTSDVEEIASPDIYTLEIPGDGYQEVEQLLSGKLSVNQTPEQREQFLDWMEKVLAKEGRSVDPALNHDDWVRCDECGEPIDFREVTSFSKTWNDEYFWHDECVPETNAIRSVSPGNDQTEDQS